MKQKYRIWKNVEGENLLIQEYAVLTADSRKQKLSGLQNEDFSLICEQTYRADEVKDAFTRGKDELILLLRNQHFFPIGLHVDLIADAVIAMYASKGEQHEDLIFDDKEILQGTLPEIETIAASDDETSEKPENDIDELLEDDSQIKKDNSTDNVELEQLNGGR
jgi:hypothetical protein